MENGMSFSKYYTNTYDDLYKMFKNANYYTSYAHGNDAYFWNRGNVYSRLGVQDIILKDKLEETEYINGFLSDETVYLQTAERMKQYQEPFISFIVAASSHTPYELEGLQDRSKVSIDVGKYKNTYLGNYLEAVNYADYSLGVFFEKLKEEGIYEDAAILVFGDHNGMNMYNDELLDFLKSTNPNINDVEIKLNYARVACGMKIPGINSLKIEKTVSKLDIKPTLTYLAGIEDGFSLGTNMFGSKEFVALNNERIITNKYYYDENWYEIKTGNLIEMETLDEDTKKLLEQYYNYMKTELEISNSVSINNLLEEK
jgi:phosphoglycerol transferase MdoB-like AlkP superfamily enzyme